MGELHVKVPASVPADKKSTYIDIYRKITHSSGKLMLFAGDQKVEHLNDDFYGEGIPSEDNDPEHLFKIASKSKIGVFATQLGMISRYGSDYKDVPYLVKVNSKTNLVKTEQDDPLSRGWYDMKRIAEFKKNSGLNIMGIGFTIYLGSEYEGQMLREAARLVYDAHQEGMVSVLWIYPRGNAVPNEKDAHLIAGAAGVAAALGADFVKVSYPKVDEGTRAEALKEAVQAAGRTKLVCAGGSSEDPKEFLQKLHDQIHIGGAEGNATGRNIHQKSLDKAVKLCNAINAITIEGSSVDKALEIYNS